MQRLSPFLLLLFVTSTAFCQEEPKEDSVEAAAKRFVQRSLAYKEANKIEDEEFPVPELNSTNLKPGMIGSLAWTGDLEVQQVIDEETIRATAIVFEPQVVPGSIRVEQRERRGGTFFLKGIKTAGLSDGQRFGASVYEVIEPRTYTTVAGARATSPVLVPFKMKEVKPLLEKVSAEAKAEMKQKQEEAAALAKKEAEEKQFREWTDKSGKFSIEARLKEFRDNQVWLVFRDGKEVGLPMLKLSDDDQKYVREELRRRRDSR